MYNTYLMWAKEHHVINMHCSVWRSLTCGPDVPFVTPPPLAHANGLLIFRIRNFQRFLACLHCLVKKYIFFIAIVLYLFFAVVIVVFREKYYNFLSQYLIFCVFVIVAIVVVVIAVVFHTFVH